MSYAQIAVSVVCLLSAGVSVTAAVACFRTLRKASTGPSMTSLLSEIHEMRDYVTKLDGWSRRVNQRLTMRERRETQNGQAEAPASSASSTKDELRRRAGLVAGKPAPHQ